MQNDDSAPSITAYRRMVGGGRIARQGCGYDAFDQPAHDHAQRLHERGRRPQAAGRGDREDQADSSRHAGRDDLGFAGLPPGRFAIKFARALGGERDLPPWPGRTWSAVRSKPRLPTECWPIPTRPTTRIRPSQSHPGCSVVPRLWRRARSSDIDGTRFLRAVALGYDIGPRVTRRWASWNTWWTTHRSTHAISGTFCSAAAAGCAASLNAQQMRWLLSYTAQQASGLASWQRDTDHIEKAFDFAGMAGAQRSNFRVAGPGRRYRRRRYPVRR